uniref:Uso1/p115-like vesicle tethering protein C-terminal domain-containing protein n=1 Tax=Tetraselmis sp. GSL018 TaxID=582737 RepID=A0A061R2Z3_9CHLO
MSENSSSFQSSDRGSVLGRIGGLLWRSNSSKKPPSGAPKKKIVAKLPEGNNFYFDPETKTWKERGKEHELNSVGQPPSPPKSFSSSHPPSLFGSTDSLSAIGGAPDGDGQHLGKNPFIPGPNMYSNRSSMKDLRKRYVDVAGQSGLTKSFSSSSDFMVPPAVNQGSPNKVSMFVPKPVNGTDQEGEQQQTGPAMFIPRPDASVGQDEPAAGPEIGRLDAAAQMTDEPTRAEGIASGEMSEAATGLEESVAADRAAPGNGNSTGDGSPGIIAEPDDSAVSGELSFVGSAEVAGPNKNMESVGATNDDGAYAPSHHGSALPSLFAGSVVGQSKSAADFFAQLESPATASPPLSVAGFEAESRASLGPSGLGEGCRELGIDADAVFGGLPGEAGSHSTEEHPAGHQWETGQQQQQEMGVSEQSTSMDQQLDYSNYAYVPYVDANGEWQYFYGHTGSEEYRYFYQLYCEYYAQAAQPEGQGYPGQDAWQQGQNSFDGEGAAEQMMDVTISAQDASMGEGPGLDGALAAAMGSASAEGGESGTAGVEDGIATSSLAEGDAQVPVDGADLCRDTAEVMRVDAAPEDSPQIVGEGAFSGGAFPGAANEAAVAPPNANTSSVLNLSAESAIEALQSSLEWAASAGDRVDGGVLTRIDPAANAACSGAEGASTLPDGPDGQGAHLSNGDANGHSEPSYSKMGAIEEFGPQVVSREKPRANRRSSKQKASARDRTSRSKAGKLDRALPWEAEEAQDSALPVEPTAPQNGLTWVDEDEDLVPLHVDTTEALPADSSEGPRDEPASSSPPAIGASAAVAEPVFDEWGDVGLVPEAEGILSDSAIEGICSQSAQLGPLETASGALLQGEQDEPHAAVPQSTAWFPPAHGADLRGGPPEELGVEVDLPEADGRGDAGTGLEEPALSEVCLMTKPAAASDHTSVNDGYGSSSGEANGHLLGNGLPGEATQEAAAERAVDFSPDDLALAVSGAPKEDRGRLNGIILAEEGPAEKPGVPVEALLAVDMIAGAHTLDKGLGGACGAPPTQASGQTSGIWRARSFDGRTHPQQVPAGQADFCAAVRQLVRRADSAESAEAESSKVMRCRLGALEQENIMLRVGRKVDAERSSELEAKVAVLERRLAEFGDELAACVQFPCTAVLRANEDMRTVSLSVAVADPRQQIVSENADLRQQLAQRTEEVQRLLDLEGVQTKLLQEQLDKQQLEVQMMVELEQENDALHGRLHSMERDVRNAQEERDAVLATLRSILFELGAVQSAAEQADRSQRRAAAARSEALEDALQGALSEREELRSRVAELEAEICSAVQRAEARSEEASGLSADADRLRAEAGELREQVDAADEEISRLLKEQEEAYDTEAELRRKCFQLEEQLSASATTCEEQAQSLRDALDREAALREEAERLGGELAVAREERNALSRQAEGLRGEADAAAGENDRLCEALKRSEAQAEERAKAAAAEAAAEWQEALTREQAAAAEALRELEEVKSKLRAAVKKGKAIDKERRALQEELADAEEQRKRAGREAEEELCAVRAECEAFKGELHEALQREAGALERAEASQRLLLALSDAAGKATGCTEDLEAADGRRAGLLGAAVELSGEAVAEAAAALWRQDSIHQELERTRVAACDAQARSQEAEGRCKELEGIEMRLSETVETQQSEFNDLLACLGQETAKVFALQEALEEKGVDVESILARVEQEHGFGEGEEEEASSGGA